MHRSQSVDNELNRMDTPNKKTPVFGSIERGLDKVKTIFTPRKRLTTLETPRKARDTCNITIVNNLNPEIIMEELIGVISSKHLLYERKGLKIKKIKKFFLLILFFFLIQFFASD